MHSDFDRELEFERLGSCTAGLTGRRVKLPVERLALGMRVEALDKPWLESGFAFQGFFIESADDLRALCEECREVFVTVTRGAEEEAAFFAATRAPAGAKLYQFPLAQRSSRVPA